MAKHAAARRARDPALVRLGLTVSNWTERWFPDAFIFALAAIVVVFIAGVLLGRSPQKMTEYFGGGFWTLIVFTMQMTLIIVFGYVVASSPPVYRIVQTIAGIPKGPRSAVATIAFFTVVSSLLSWGFSLVFGGLLAREVVRRVPQTDYRAAGAAGYLGLGSVWALGLSSSAALLMATKGSIPATLLPISGVLPLANTIFLWQSMVIAGILVALSVLVAYLTAPGATSARTAGSFGITVEPLKVSLPPRQRPGEWLEYSPILTIVIVLIGLAYLATVFGGNGDILSGIAQALDLNTYNFIFLLAGLLLHWRPRSFLTAVTQSVPASAGVLIQFPFYAGIFGMIVGLPNDPSPISKALADLFVHISDQNTYPILLSIYSAILGVFVPSGGSKWVIEAPYVLQAANQLHVNLGWTVQIYNAAEALPNLLNPFWMLPLLGLLGLRARDLIGYSVIQFVVHVPVVIFLVWLFAKTLDYAAPVIPK
ncbi:MAG TPA: Short chain fatty acid transporter [Chloroflexi bacterium]|jgi:short-chain fatty acids transporter|nr:Short chain fatty acid transporter [Chloroflexota bacterium]HAL25763.1 Short chain fatty acid transporter [Chloroflexota bacterium]